MMINGPATVTANWKTQYYIGVNSAHGQASGAGWYDSNASASLGTSTLDAASDTVRYMFSSWSDGSNTPAISLVVTGAQNFTVNWVTQFYLSVSSSTGSPTGAGWYDANSTATFAVSSPVSAGNSTGTQYVFTTWQGDSSAASSSASLVMDSPKSVTAHWKTQYYVTVSSDSGSVTGEGWYDAGSTATVTVSSTDGFGGWMVNGVLASYDGTMNTLVSGPLNVEASWAPPSIANSNTLVLGGIVVGFVVVLAVLLIALRKH